MAAHVVHIARKLFRAQVRKQRRKKKRQSAAQVRDAQNEEDVTPVEGESEDETESRENISAEEDPLRSEAHTAWLEREKLAQVEFEKVRQAEELSKQKEMEERKRIQEEWEEQRKKELEKEEDAKGKKDQELENVLKQLDAELGIEKGTPREWRNPEAPPSNSTQSAASKRERRAEVCSFFVKTGACRFNGRCSRTHPATERSSTLLFRRMYTNFGLGPDFRDEYDADVGLECDEESAYVNFHEFYEDVLPEFRACGDVVQLKVCRNWEPHLRGNVYVQFSTEDEAVKALQTLGGRFYGGHQLNPWYCSVAKWKPAICGLFHRNRCPKGKHCNFLHVFINPRGEFSDADRDIPPGTPRFPNRRDSQQDRYRRRRSRSRSRGRYERGRRRSAYERRRSRSRSRERRKRRRSRSLSGGRSTRRTDEKNRSRNGRRNRSRSRDRSRSKSRDRSRSKSEGRSRSRDRRSKSRGRGRCRTRSRSRSRERRDGRSRSKSLDSEDDKHSHASAEKTRSREENRRLGGRRSRSREGKSRSHSKRGRCSRSRSSSKGRNRSRSRSKDRRYRKSRSSSPERGYYDNDGQRNGETRPRSRSHSSESAGSNGEELNGGRKRGNRSSRRMVQDVGQHRPGGRLGKKRASPADSFAKDGSSSDSERDEKSHRLPDAYNRTPISCDQKDDDANSRTDRKSARRRKARKRKSEGGRHGKRRLSVSELERKRRRQQMENDESSAGDDSSDRELKDASDLRKKEMEIRERIKQRQRKKERSISPAGKGNVSRTCIKLGGSSIGDDQVPVGEDESTVHHDVGGRGQEEAEEAEEAEEELLRMLALKSFRKKQRDR